MSDIHGENYDLDEGQRALRFLRGDVLGVEALLPQGFFVVPDESNLDIHVHREEDGYLMGTVSPQWGYIVGNFSPAYESILKRFANELCSLVASSPYGQDGAPEKTSMWTSANPVEDVMSINADRAIKLVSEGWTLADIMDTYPDIWGRDEKGELVHLDTDKTMDRRPKTPKTTEGVLTATAIALPMMYGATREVGETGAGVRASLSPEEDRVWEKAFEYYVNEGYSDGEADQRAWVDLVKEFPRLNEYGGITGASDEMWVQKHNPHETGAGQWDEEEKELDKSDNTPFAGLGIPIKKLDFKSPKTFYRERPSKREAFVGFNRVSISAERENPTQFHVVLDRSVIPGEEITEAFQATFSKVDSVFFHNGFEWIEIPPLDENMCLQEWSPTPVFMAEYIPGVNGIQVWRSDVPPDEMIKASEAKGITGASRGEKRYVYGTRDEKWHLVGPEDRDYMFGIPKDEFERIGPGEAESRYLKTQLIGKGLRDYYTGAKPRTTQKRAENLVKYLLEEIPGVGSREYDNLLETGDGHEVVIRAVNMLRSKGINSHADLSPKAQYYSGREWWSHQQTLSTGASDEMWVLLEQDGWYGPFVDMRAAEEFARRFFFWEDEATWLAESLSKAKDSEYMRRQYLEPLGDGEVLINPAEAMQDAICGYEEQYSGEERYRNPEHHQGYYGMKEWVRKHNPHETGAKRGIRGQELVDRLVFAFDYEVPIIEEGTSIVLFAPYEDIKSFIPELERRGATLRVVEGRWTPMLLDDLAFYKWGDFFEMDRGVDVADIGQNAIWLDEFVLLGFNIRPEDKGKSFYAFEKDITEEDGVFGVKRAWAVSRDSPSQTGQFPFPSAPSLINISLPDLPAPPIPGATGAKPSPETEGIVKEAVRNYWAKPGPRVGDVVRFPNGTLHRITHIWSFTDTEERDVQTAPLGSGSYHLSESGYMSYSGALDGCIPIEKLRPTGERMEARAWVWGRGYQGAGEGVQTTVPVEVFELTGTDNYGRDGRQSTGAEDLRYARDEVLVNDTTKKATVMPKDEFNKLLNSLAPDYDWHKHIKEIYRDPKDFYYAITPDREFRVPGGTIYAHTELASSAGASLTLIVPMAVSKDEVQKIIDRYHREDDIVYHSVKRVDFVPSQAEEKVVSKEEAWNYPTRITIDILREHLKKRGMIQLKPNPFFEDGLIIDIQTISLLLQVYDAVNEANKEKMARMVQKSGPLAQVMDLAWRSTQTSAGETGAGQLDEQEEDVIMVEYTKYKIVELIEKQIFGDVHVRGVIIDVKRQSTQDNVIITLDDGTAAVNVHLARDLAEKLTKPGVSRDEFIEMALARAIEVKGDAFRGEYNMEIDASDVGYKFSTGAAPGRTGAKFGWAMTKCEECGEKFLSETGITRYGTIQPMRSFCSKCRVDETRKPGRTGAHNEYPLYGHYKLCPTARYVGGVSQYLCECPNPERCPGVRAAAPGRTGGYHGMGLPYPSQTNTPEMEMRVLAAAKKLTGRGDVRVVFEHDQWWAIDSKGAQWDIVDACGPGTIDGFDVERVR